ncbi:phosphatidate cytidylyltransferase [Vicingaceae bacterium]|nr:phosphatidate cytidylyltransferase [Vicingaceae bacterium]
MNNFTQRALTGIIFVLVLLGAIALSEYASAILFFFIILLGTREFYSFFQTEDVAPQKTTGIVSALIYFILTVFINQGQLGSTALFALVPITFFIFLKELYRNKPTPIANISYTLLGIIYVALPMTLLYELSFINDNQFGGEYNYQIVLGFFFLLWANDTGAYLVGRKLGRTKLFERISPKKTWEGSIGGGLMGLGIGYMNALLFPDLSLINWLVVALIVLIFGSLGDLVESMFKRSLNIKDSGKLLPGHGGLLDRFDGIFIAAPIVYTYLRFIFAI